MKTLRERLASCRHLDGDRTLDCTFCRDDERTEFEKTERRDGPRYVEAIRGARVVRYVWVNSDPESWRYAPGAPDGLELAEGIPTGWVLR